MGLKRYKIKFLKNVSKKDLPALPKTIKLRIEEIVKERLTVNPIDLGESLRYKLKGHRRIRTGDYRIMYHVNAAKYEVTIVSIKHRKDIYES
ncbi:type II toxin-antitoxin system RelE family toxin [Wolbachia endosymbiont (group B) of Silvanus unidentatus]|uniref:type II toxin-antitoxin system RelE family toxin n=1 Tax=Wolbachia endosymbiont (group B) of Silvanus unidentatus TaxID=3066137 RepID=UPI0033412842